MNSSSSVLIIGHPRPDEVRFGAQCAGTLEEALHYLNEKSASIIVFGRTAKAQQFDRLRARLEETSSAHWVVVTDGLKPSQLISTVNTGRVRAFLPNFETPDFDLKVQTALEAFQNIRQSETLETLLEEQNHHLSQLSLELEQRVNRRQKTLQRSRQKLAFANQKQESLSRALMGVHRASSLSEIESVLNDVFNPFLNLSWVRIVFENQTLIPDLPGEIVFKAEIPLPDQPLKGYILFARSKEQPFNSDESEFFFEVSEAVSLALRRMAKIDLAESLKQQWDATFDSISHPLCIVDHEYRILRTNLAFVREVPDRGHGRRAEDVFNQDVFKVFFGHAEDLRHLGFDFQIRLLRGDGSATEYFDVLCQPLNFELSGRQAHLVIFRNVSDQIKLERRVLESSKLAELGTIASSIAHELNNPLGGMLSFLQLILMDIDKSHAAFDDVKEMEAATLRCKDIVQNLLGFARRQDLGSAEELDLLEVVKRSIKLIELQSKSKGIAIELDGESGACPFQGSANALSQAICNLLQNAIDAIADEIVKKPSFTGLITIALHKESAQYLIRVTDNASGIRPEHQTQVFTPLFTTKDPGSHAGLGLTVAYTIVTEHRGSLEILSQTGSGTSAILALPRPEFTKSSRGFDREI